MKTIVLETYEEPCKDSEEAITRLRDSSVLISTSTTLYFINYVDDGVVTEDLPHELRDVDLSGLHIGSQYALFEGQLYNMDPICMMVWNPCEYV